MGDVPDPEPADAHPTVLLVTKGLDIGGLERIVVDLALVLDRRGIETHVAVVSDQRDALVPALSGSNVQLHHLGGSDRIGVRAAARLIRLVRHLDVDVVHVHGPLPSVLIRLVPCRSAIVTTSHTPWHGLNPLTRLAWRLTAHRDRAIIAVSSAVHATLPSRIRRRAIVIPHGVDMAAIEKAATARSGRPSASATQPIAEDERRPSLRAITVASHRDVKNYPNLLDAIARARRAGADIELLAVGEGPGYDRHVRHAASLGIADVVHFVPPSTDVLELIASSDVLVVASDYEGQPMVVAEALALGVPVVATAVGRVPEMVEPSVGRIVRPGDPVGLADALVELATDPATLLRMTQAASRYDGVIRLDDTVEAHLQIYRAVARVS